MHLIPAEFVPPTIPENEKYEGTEVDANVLKALPSSVTIKWSSISDASFWALRGNVQTILPDGQEKSYFLKVYTVPSALKIARGEFESTQRLAAALPDNVPRAVAHGVCANNPNRAFFLAEFRDMIDELPKDPGTVAAVVLKMHQQLSPTGKFGFHVTTFGGKHPSDNTWCDTWEEFFTRATKDTIEAELAIHGPDEELQGLSEKTLTKVIPRLIRPLETEGRRIQPVLLHGDLWHGNVSVDKSTKEPVLYDPCCFYGHNEYDFGMWRAARYDLTRSHVQAYYELAKRNDPKQGQDANHKKYQDEDRDDRNALYAMRCDLMVSICWPANKNIRELAKQEMRRLVGKYGDGYEGYLASKTKGEAEKEKTPFSP